MKRTIGALLLTLLPYYIGTALTFTDYLSRVSLGEYAAFVTSVTTVSLSTFLFWTVLIQVAVSLWYVNGSHVRAPKGGPK